MFSIDDCHQLIRNSFMHANTDTHTQMRMWRDGPNLFMYSEWQIKKQATGSKEVLAAFSLPSLPEK